MAKFVVNDSHAGLWLKLGISSKGRGQYAQYRFMVLPKTLVKVYRSKGTLSVEESQKLTKEASSFEDFKGQVDEVCAIPGLVDMQTLEQIERDLPRTFPNTDDREEQMELLTSLRKLLIAVAAEYPEAGYVQGQNFIAAFIILHCRNVDASFALLRLLVEIPLF